MEHGWYALKSSVGVGVWQQAHISDSIDQQRARIASEILKDARSQLTKGHG